MGERRVAAGGNYQLSMGAEIGREKELAAGQCADATAGTMPRLAVVAMACHYRRATVTVHCCPSVVTWWVACMLGVALIDRLVVGH